MVCERSIVIRRKTRRLNRKRLPYIQRLWLGSQMRNSDMGGLPRTSDPEASAPHRKPSEGEWICIQNDLTPCADQAWEHATGELQRNCPIHEIESF